MIYLSIFVYCTYICTYLYVDIDLSTTCYIIMNYILLCKVNMKENASDQSRILVTDLS